MDAGHGVERVRQNRGAAIEGLPRQVEPGIRVPDGHDDARRDQAVDRIERAGQFGCDRDLPERAVGCLQQRVDGCRVGLDEVCGLVRPPVQRRKERPLEMRPQDERVVRGELGDES
jgi:hypothetical protein